MVSRTRTENRRAGFRQRKFAKHFPQFPKKVAAEDVSRGPGEFSSLVLAKPNKLPDKCKMVPVISFTKTLCQAWITRCHCQRKEPSTSRFLIFWNYFFPGQLTIQQTDNKKYYIYHPPRLPSLFHSTSTLLQFHFYPIRKSCICRFLCKCKKNFYCKVFITLLMREVNCFH